MNFHETTFVSEPFFLTKNFSMIFFFRHLAVISIEENDSLISRSQGNLKQFRPTFFLYYTFILCVDSQFENPISLTLHSYTTNNQKETQMSACMCRIEFVGNFTLFLTLRTFILTFKLFIMPKSATQWLHQQNEKKTSFKKNTKYM